MRKALVAGLACLALALPARGHYHILLADKPFAKKGDAVTVTCLWGHPYEHQLFDSAKPEALVVFAPDGKKVDLTAKLEKVTLPGDKGKKVDGYRVRFTPEERGDFLFLLQMPPVFLEEDELFVRDTARLTVHVQAEKGWGRQTGEELGWEPLTRPYGLLPGDIFQATLYGLSASGKGRATQSGAPVEVERYNPAPPKEIPADPFVTRTSRTSANGVATTTLPQAGWWAMTGSRNVGTMKREGKDYPVRLRTTLWLFVHDKPVSK